MIIDFHVHAGEVPQHFSKQFATEMMNAVGKEPNDLSVNLSSLIYEMDHNGVDKAVLLAFEAPWVGVHVTNQYVSNLISQYPGRFFGFASFDAKTPITWNMLEHAHRKQGLIGYKLAFGYQNVAPEDPAWRNLYLYASTYNLPVLVHLGYTPISKVNMAYCMPKRLYQVCEEYKNMIVIVAHMGWPWIRDTLMLIENFENVYADLSVLSVNLSMEQILDLLHQARDRGVIHKLIWGSDYPIFTMKSTVSFLQDIREQTTRSGLLAGEQWDTIQYRTAEALLLNKG